MIDFLDGLTRFGLAVVLGGLVGLERKARGRQAGLRTFILVCLGSTLMMMVSLAAAGFAGTNGDPGRIAAQVVTGIGFLGAGAILREGATVRGLTTAAGLWVVAGIGLAIGIGMFAEAAVVTVIVLITLVMLSRLEDAVLPGRDQLPVTLTIRDRPGAIGEVASLLGSRGVDIRDVQVRPTSEACELLLELRVRLPARLDLLELSGALSALPAVITVDLSRQEDPGARK
jgi:putative Mg2+ transporter-C (MgtC) family protein